jgi:DNA-binding MarR family transcriptional regulator
MTNADKLLVTLAVSEAITPVELAKRARVQTDTARSWLRRAVIAGLVNKLKVGYRITAKGRERAAEVIDKNSPQFETP